MDGTGWKTGIYAALVVFALWSIYLYFYDPALLTWITREDSVAESVSAICYLLAAGIFFIEWIHGGFRNIFVLGYALLFLMVGGEEISWGQRIVGVPTPEALMDANVQNEMNLHNIDGIQQHVRMVGLMVVLTIAMLMPLTRKWLRIFRALYTRLAIPVVPLWTVPITIFAILFMAVPRFIWQESIFTLDEIGELYLSFTFLIFAIAMRASSPKTGSALTKAR